MDRRNQNRAPLSLRELKRRRDEEASHVAKPVFQSKEERRAAALKRLAEKRANERDAILSPRKRPRSPERHESRHIKSDYMRAPQHVKSSRKSSRKQERRFRFDWDATDDTTTDDQFHLEILSKASKPQFGRGLMGGMSRPIGKRSRFEDSRHWSEKSREEMDEHDWRIFREDYQITLRSAAPNPARYWNETSLPQDILRLVQEVARYKTPSPIQMASIPIGLTDRDLIGLAETGSGKTAAFVLPMLVKIRAAPRMTRRIAADGPYVLVLAPTRELALQIDAEARKFAEHMGIRVVPIIGGQELDVQALQLQAGCEMVVCTPGRMVDLLSKQMAALGNCKYLVLDEADRMIDMGFEPQVSEILDSMPTGKRQTFMFSATMSSNVERLAKTYLREAIVISIGETGKAAENVNQRVEYFSTEGKRRHRFVHLLQTLQAPILVFLNTRSGCEMIVRYVEANSHVRPAIMHSGKSQDQRGKTLEGFRSGRHKVLVATDVVGRGIDIKGIRNVINFELPKTIEAYTHRIGRTGRAGEKGTAWSLATEADTELFESLAQMLRQCGAFVPQEIANAKSTNGKFRPITD